MFREPQPNVLIDDEGRARLCDFGLSRTVADFQGTQYLTSNLGGALRWMDPVLLQCGADGDEKPIGLSTGTDVYSLGSVMLQVRLSLSDSSRNAHKLLLQILSGEVPYHYCKVEPEVINRMYKGETPRRPVSTTIADAPWAVIQRCWDSDHSRRPSARDVRVEVGAMLQQTKHNR